MSIRIRTIDGVTVAICAARSVEKPGDVYLDDAQHHALAEKFREDFTSEGAVRCRPGCPDEAAIRAREESDNPSREWWDSVYGPKTQNRHPFAPRKRNTMCRICGLGEPADVHLIAPPSSLGGK